MWVKGAVHHFLLPYPQISSCLLPNYKMSLVYRGGGVFLHDSEYTSALAKLEEWRIGQVQEELGSSSALPSQMFFQPVLEGRPFWPLRIERYQEERRGPAKSPPVYYSWLTSFLLAYFPMTFHPSSMLRLHASPGLHFLRKDGSCVLLILYEFAYLPSVNLSLPI